MSSGKEFKFGNEGLQLLLKGVTTLAEAVKVTLGPSGRNVLLNRPGQEPHLTKDGVTVANEVYMSNPFEDAGAQLVKAVAAKTADDAGDGTTTATLMAEVLLREGVPYITDDINVVEVKRGMDKALDAVVQHLKKHSKKCKSLKSMKNVATISANSDKAIGHMVAKAVHGVGEEGVVTVELGSSLQDEVETVEGYQFDCGYISPYFVTNKEKQIAEFDSPYILIADQKISYIRDIIKIVEAVVKTGHPILIFAHDVDGDALTSLAINHVNGKLSAAAVRAPAMGTLRTDMLTDIACFTGGSVVSKELDINLNKTTLQHLGKADKVIVTSEETTIISGYGDTLKIKERLDSIKNTEVKDNQAKQIKELRMGKLSGKVAVISVGGMSELEMKERKDRVDDALFATKAAVKEGVLPGGGVALLRASSELSNVECNNKDQDLGVQIVKMALTAPICQIAHNAGIDPDEVLYNIKDQNKYSWGYDAHNAEYVDMFESGILDPTKVTRSAIQNAVSVAGTLLTTQCTISESQSEADKRHERIKALKTMMEDTQDNE